MNIINPYRYGFNPLSGNPKLWLDPTDPLSLQSLNGDLLVTGLFDKASSFNETNQYTSNFSAGTDGWLALRGTMTGNVDSINGENDVLEIYLDTQALPHSMRKQSVNTVGNAYRFRATVYIPSANTNCDGFSVGDNIGNYYKVFTFSSGSWIDIDFIYISTATELRIYALSGTDDPISGAATFAGAGSSTDDLIYIKNVSIDEVDGYHFSQDTYANRPLVNSLTVPTKIDFTAANSEWLDGSNHKTAFEGDTVGEWMFAFKNLGASAILKGLGTIDAGGSEVLRFERNGNKMGIYDGTNSIYGDTDINDSSLHVVSINGNGSTYNMYVDNVAQTITGTNTGKWHNDYTWATNCMAICRQNTSYGDVDFLEEFYFDKLLSVAERTKYVNYLTNKH